MVKKERQKMKYSLKLYVTDEVGRNGKKKGY